MLALRLSSPCRIVARPALPQPQRLQKVKVSAMARLQKGESEENVCAALGKENPKRILIVDAFIAREEKHPKKK